MKNKITLIGFIKKKNNVEVKKKAIINLKC